MKKKNVIKTIAFLAIMVLLFVGVNNLFIPNWISDTAPTLVWNNLKAQEKNTVSTAFIGSSQFSYGFSSMKLAEDWDIPSLTCATGNQPILCAQYYLKEMRKKQDIKLVVYDVSMLYEPEYEVRYQQTLDTAPFSMNKMQILFEHLESETSNSVLSYLFPISTYHSRWAELGKSDYYYVEENVPIYKGNVLTPLLVREMTHDRVIIDNDGQEGVVKDDATLNGEETPIGENQDRYFREFVEYCTDNNIELLLVKTPKDNWAAYKHEGIQKYADEYGLTFIDFNEEEYISQLDLDYENDFKDLDHLNSRGALKFTDWLGKYISENYSNVTGVSKKYYNTKDEAKRYYDDLDDAFLGSAINTDEIFERLDNDRYDIVISVTGDTAEYADKLQPGLEKLGLEVNLKDVGDEGYIAFLSKGKTKASADASNFDAESKTLNLEFTNSFGKKTSVRLKPEGTPAVMTVGDLPTKFSNRGVNVMVIEKSTDMVIYSATLTSEVIFENRD